MEDKGIWCKLVGDEEVKKKDFKKGENGVKIGKKEWKRKDKDNIGVLKGRRDGEESKRGLKKLEIGIEEMEENLEEEEEVGDILKLEKLYNEGCEKMRMRIES